MRGKTTSEYNDTSYEEDGKETERKEIMVIKEERLEGKEDFWFIKWHRKETEEMQEIVKKLISRGWKLISSLR